MKVWIWIGCLFVASGIMVAIEAGGASIPPILKTVIAGVAIGIAVAWCKGIDKKRKVDKTESETGQVAINEPKEFCPSSEEATTGETDGGKEKNFENEELDIETQEEYQFEDAKRENCFLEEQKPKQQEYNYAYAFENIDEEEIEINNKQEDFEMKSCRRIGKLDAIDICRSQGVSFLSRNCTFASFNRSGYCYWANPKIDLLQENWTIIMNDTNNLKLYVFQIPAGAILLYKLKVRNDKPYLIDLQVRYGDGKFTDNRSGMQFAKWLVKIIYY